MFSFSLLFGNQNNLANNKGDRYTVWGSYGLIFQSELQHGRTCFSIQQNPSLAIKVYVGFELKKKMLPQLSQILV